MRMVSKKRAGERRAYAKAKEEAFAFYGYRCVCSGWSEIPCSDELEPDHVVPLGRGGKYADPNNIWPLCHACHHLKTHVLVKGSEILGLYGIKKQEEREFEFYLEHPDGIWSEEIDDWLGVWNAEKRYMTTGKRD